MRLCVDVPEDTAVRIKRYLLDTFHTTYKVQQPMLLEAVLEYLDRKSMPPAMPEKKSEKRRVGAPTPVSREGEARRPRIRDDPELVRKIDAMIADGKTIAEIAREIGYSWSTVKSYLQHASLERI
jgi:DNA-binding NarL/FixJ family response regulator